MAGRSNVGVPSSVSEYNTKIDFSMDMDTVSGWTEDSITIEI